MLPLYATAAMRHAVAAATLAEPLRFAAMPALLRFDAAD